MFSKNLTKGFTLVELVVTVGIFALVSAVVLARSSNFDNEVLLNDLAYDVALAVRQAQQYGIDVRASEGTFDRPYGVYFTAGTSTFVEFVDKDDDGFYEEGVEDVQTFTLGRGATIGTICEVGGTCKIGDLTVLFKRPDPDAIINQGGMSQVRIEVKPPSGPSRYVSVSSTGQISIQKP